MEATASFKPELKSPKNFTAIFSNSTTCPLYIDGRRDNMFSLIQSNFKLISFAFSFFLHQNILMAKREELKRVFSCFDVDGDDKIFAAKLRFFMLRTIGEEMSLEDAEEFITSIN